MCNKLVGVIPRKLLNKEIIAGHTADVAAAASGCWKMLVSRDWSSGPIRIGRQTGLHSRLRAHVLLSSSIWALRSCRAGSRAARYMDVTDNWTKCCPWSQESQLETAEHAVLSVPATSIQIRKPVLFRRVWIPIIDKTIINRKTIGLSRQLHKKSDSRISNYIDFKYSCSIQDFKIK